MSSRALITAGLAASAALFLSGCAETQDTTTEDTEDTAAQTTAEATTSTETTTEDTATTSQNSAAATSASAQPTGEDPAFGAINAALAQYPDGTVVSVDREDDSDTYDIDVVSNNEITELEVAADGTVREDEREGEDDDVQAVQNATVTAEDAIRQALEQHPDGVLDEAQLEDEDGNLRWEIELDDADRNDLAEVTIPAN